MGFKDYCNNYEKEKITKSSVGNENTKNVEELYDKYKDKNEDELLSELFKNVAKQKEDGTFNYEGLLNTINKVSPFLSKEQNLKIKEILKNIQ